VPACHVEGALPFPLACLGDSGGESGALAAEGAIYLLPGLKANCWIAFLRPLEAPNSGAPIDQSAADAANAANAVNAAKRPMQQMLENRLF
jgi:hypothetical protein